jgi:cation diffusion facilitator family transporter
MPGLYQNRRSRGERAALLGVFGNILLSAVKFTAGVLSGSVAVIADSLHSFSDILVSGVTWFGIRLSSKPADEGHPYGHGDIEPIVGLIISIILAVAGFEYARHSLEALSTVSLPPGILAVYVTIFSIVFKELMSRYTLRVAEDIRSPALKADALNHRSDVYTSIAVLAGVSGAILGYPILDPLAGILVSIVIIKIGFEVGKENILQLMGTSPGPELNSRIMKAVSGIKEVKLVHKIRVHGVGAYYTVDLHVCVDEALPLGEAHQVAHRVEKRILKSFPEISSALVHIEPYDFHHEINHKK